VKYTIRIMIRNDVFRISKSCPTVSEKNIQPSIFSKNEQINKYLHAFAVSQELVQFQRGVLIFYGKCEYISNGLLSKL